MKKQEITQDDVTKLVEMNHRAAAKKSRMVQRKQDQQQLVRQTEKLQKEKKS